MSDPFNVAIEKYRNSVEEWKVQIKSRYDWQLESFKSLIQFALAVARGIILANGGAAVAILAFLGNIWAKEPKAHDVAKAITEPLSLFLIGIAAGIGILASAYVAQSFFTVYWNKTGFTFQAIGLLLAIAGLATFIVGALNASNVLATHFP